MIIRVAIILHLVVLSPLLLPGQKAFSHDAGAIQTEIFVPVDLSFEASNPGQHPFEMTFGAVFTHADGNSIKVEGFYNGGREYRIRFSPTKVGTWSFATYAADPELSGKKGEIMGLANTGPASRGPIEIDVERPQKFIYADGSSYFALAFELDWLFALDYGNAAGIPKTEQIIEAVKANGFNQIVMNVYAFDVGWKTAGDVPDRYQFGQPPYSVFGGTNANPDFSTLNIDFFRHFDRVINYLQQNDIVAHLMIYVWNKKVNWPAMYTEADNRYFDYVIKRYQAFSNVIWDVSKEALDYGRCDIPYINERIQRIRRQDAYGRLITVHDYEYCSRQPDRVDFISIQNWRNDLYSLSLEALLLHADKPVMNIEHGGYEKGPYLTFQGNYTDPVICLIRNYECLFAGLYSTYYWQNTSWNIVVYDPMAPGHPFPEPQFAYYKYLQELFQRYDFNRLFPYKPKLTTNGRPGPENLSSSGYPLSSGDGLYLYLLPATNFQTNVVIPKPENGQLTATWFNPLTGVYRDAGTSEWRNWKPYRSPWEQVTSVLIIQAE